MPITSGAWRTPQNWRTSPPIGGVVWPFLVLFLIQLLPQMARAQEAPLALVTAVQSFIETRGVHGQPTFRHALIDLDGDGRPDAIVLLRSQDWCGSGGCTMLVFRGM